MASAKIHSVETLGALDGPGIRYILFMKGCPLRCAFCHNPDTWASPQFSSRSAAEVAADVLRYKEFFDASGGGFTASGGEPLLQPLFLEELFGILKREGVSTAVDTCGYVENISDVRGAVELADLFLLDIKHLDDAVHRRLTGKSNGRVLEFLGFLDKLGKEIHIRVVLINDISADSAYLELLASFLKKYPSVSRVDLLPHHTLGVRKWRALGLPYRLDSSAEISDVQRLHAVEIFRDAGFETTVQ